MLRILPRKESHRYRSTIAVVASSVVMAAGLVAVSLVASAPVVVTAMASVGVSAVVTRVMASVGISASVAGVMTLAGVRLADFSALSVLMAARTVRFAGIAVMLALASGFAGVSVVFTLVSAGLSVMLAFPIPGFGMTPVPSLIVAASAVVIASAGGLGAILALILVARVVGSTGGRSQSGEKRDREQRQNNGRTARWSHLELLESDL